MYYSDTDNYNTGNPKYESATFLIEILNTTTSMLNSTSEGKVIVFPAQLWYNFFHINKINIYFNRSLENFIQFFFFLFIRQLYSSNLKLFSKTKP